VTRDFAIWVSLVVVGASCMLLHLFLLARTLRARELPLSLRWLSLFPPVTPVAAWHAGARTLTLLWAGSGLIYCALRFLAYGQH
jgi:hypothetical protein